MAGSSPVVVDRRNGPDNGRELREAVSMVCLSGSTIKIHTSKHSHLKYLFQSLAVHTRHQRQGVQQRIQNAVQSSAESFVSTYANNVKALFISGPLDICTNKVYRYFTT